STIICQSESVHGLRNLASDALDSLYKWCVFNKMAVNSKKTHLLLFNLASTSRTDKPILTYNGSQLTYVCSSKILGVTFDQKLNFQEHIVQLRKTLAWKISILHRTRNVIPKAIKIKLYYAHIQSHLYYCNIVLGTASRTHL